MIKNIVGLFLALHLVLNCLNAQSGSINIQEDASVSKLMDMFLQYNKLNNKQKGWTVIIATTTDRKTIEQHKANFLNQYPDINADWSQDKPYYKLKAGAFKKKSEAMQFIQTIKIYFPASYPAQDMLSVASFIEN